MNTINWLPFRYREFYDIPRAIIVEYRNVFYFLDCLFDEGLDDYPDYFTVYRLPADAKEWLEDITDWSDLPATGCRVGAVRVADVHFDDTKRQQIDERVFSFLE